jgi:hypothetical protein
MDAVDWMFGDRGLNRSQIERRIEPIGPGCPDEAIERCSSLAAGISSHDEIILAADGDG